MFKLIMDIDVEFIYLFKMNYNNWLMAFILMSSCDDVYVYENQVSLI